MVVSTEILLIVGGVCATAPLFKRASKDLARFLSIIGFFLGIAVIIVAIDLALSLNFLSNIFGIVFEPNTNSNYPYLKYYLPIMAVLGILLISRPLKNLRWASLISLGIGILVAAYLRVAFPGLLNNLELGIIFLIITLILFTLRHSCRPRKRILWNRRRRRLVNHDQPKLQWPLLCFPSMAPCSMM